MGLHLWTDGGVRSCGIIQSNVTSTTLPSHGIEYSRVCGRVRAYQFGRTFAFYYYYYNRNLTIDDWYVDGVSITHGSISGPLQLHTQNTSAIPLHAHGLALIKTTLEMCYHSLEKTTFVTLQSVQLRDILIINSTLMTHCGMARGVARTALAALSTTLHGSVSSSHNPPLMTLSSQCVHYGPICILPLTMWNFTFSNSR